MISREGVRELLAPTDPALVEAAAGGERFIARVRVIHWAAVWLIPVATVLTMAAPPPEVWIAFVASSMALLISIGFLFVVRRHRDPGMLPFATAAFDVTLVTVTLGAIALAGRPAVAMNSHVIWPVYFLAIVATAFRLDFRVCALAGTLAVGEYLILVEWVTARWGTVLARAGDYGDFVWATQVAKVLLLLIATGLTAGVIQQARSFARVSGNDRLTGLGNRTLFDEKLRVELQRAGREGSSLTLAFVDIDHFKQFNDRWGHAAGDQALRCVADVLRRELRAADAAFRWGGEEIIVLLPATPTSGAVAVLERVAATLRTQPLPDLPADARVTVSIGTAEAPREGTSPGALLRIADQRMLAAKRAGRDRLVAGDPVEALRAS